jgi:hypothetical protein
MKLLALSVTNMEYDPAPRKKKLPFDCGALPFKE